VITCVTGMWGIEFRRIYKIHVFYRKSKLLFWDLKRIRGGKEPGARSMEHGAWSEEPGRPLSELEGSTSPEAGLHDNMTTRRQDQSPVIGDQLKS
jgi:hypothetical protein